MALDMRALYYIALSALREEGSAALTREEARAVENRLNQNFAAIAKAIEELNAEINSLKPGV